MSLTKLPIFLTILAATVSAQVTYDAAFWEGFESEQPYEHAWLEVPDLIQNETVWWWFNQTHHFMNGIERGLYNNDSLVLHEDCFGKMFVTRINWLAAMIQHGIWKNFIQEVSIIYQLYYMLGEKCTIDRAINDVYLFCWNNGCNLERLWGNTSSNFLYMTRAMLDAAIVWYEGVPSEMQENKEQWHKLSR